MSSATRPPEYGTKEKSKAIKFETGFTGEGEPDATPEELAKEFGDT
jgi:hypothetical protein